jgi:two-component system OmpR family response regulator
MVDLSLYCNANAPASIVPLGSLHRSDLAGGAAVDATRRGRQRGSARARRRETEVPRILVIEDDRAGRESMVEALSAEGLVCGGAEDGRLGLRQVDDFRPDLIVTELLLPKLTGFELVAALRADPATRTIPVVVVTALAERSAQRRLMELGADDYLTKPFTMDELIGAVQAQLRKMSWREAGPGEAPARTVFRFARWRFDPEHRRLQGPSGAQHRLSLSETRLLRAVLENPNQVFSREDLVARLAPSIPSPVGRSVDMLIARLRRKIEVDPKNPRILETVRGVGYVLNGDAI